MSQKAMFELGNTRPIQSVRKVRNRSRRWCLTINNYSSDDYKRIVSTISVFNKWVVGKEVGEEKTEHLQCYFENKNQMDFGKVKKLFPRAHIEIAKGNLVQNYNYCTKETRFETNIDLRSFKEKIHDKILDKHYQNVVWKDWQLEVLDLINQEPDPRTINWFWENNGNVGKSFLAKYIAIKHKDVIICEGKKGDIFNQINLLMEKEIEPRIIILDIPRVSLDFINLGVVEQIKNGLLYSGKYEGGICLFSTPCVICFANEAPDKKKMSSDRWNIIEVDD